MIALDFLKQLITLTQRDIWAIEFNSRHERKILTEALDDLHLYVDTLLYLVQSLHEAKIPIQHWEKSLETLLIKFSFNGLSIHQLLTGITLKSVYYPTELNSKVIFDVPSCKNILRSQLEAFLMFHHIYVNPKTDDEKELRFCAWIYSGLLGRRALSANTDFALEQKKKDEGAIENYGIRMKSLDSFQQLSHKQKESLLSTGSGKLFYHWSKILEESGFGKNHLFTQVYSYLSVYAHSEGIAAIQMESMDSPEQNNFLAVLDVRNSQILTCLMIRALVSLFTAVKERYIALPEKLRFDIDFNCFLSDADKE